VLTGDNHAPRGAARPPSWISELEENRSLRRNVEPSEAAWPFKDEVQLC
jgi:hypothetical protein